MNSEGHPTLPKLPRARKSGTYNRPYCMRWKRVQAAILVPFMASSYSLCHFMGNSTCSCQRIGLPVHIPSNCNVVLAMLVARPDPFAHVLAEECIAKACSDGLCLFLMNCKGSLSCNHWHYTRVWRMVLIPSPGCRCQSDCQHLLERLSKPVILMPAGTLSFAPFQGTRTILGCLVKFW